jgi:periplasmic divalent cation tolerance protein
MTGFIEVEVTCPDKDCARKIARAALKARMVACANLLGGMESLFHWQGQIDSETETLLRMKAPEAHFKELCALVAQHHPYELPAITALPISHAAPGLPDWIAGECQVAKT